MFSSHCIPETLTCDNGTPYSSHAMKEYTQKISFRLTPVSPGDPKGNGFVENFVEMICKLFHTASTEHKDHKAELYKFLLHYRATSHSSTDNQ